VTGRASKHLGYATVALGGTLLLFAALLTYLQAQYGSVADNFAENKNVRYVEVTFRTGKGPSETGALRFSDVDRVGDVATDVATGLTEAVGRYRLPFGLTASDGGSYFVDGISEGGAGVVGRDSLPDGVAVGADPTARSIALDVPVVRADNGGMSSSESEQVRLNVEPLASSPPVAVFGTIAPDQFFVSEATFARLVSIVAGGIDWQTFRDLNDGGVNPSGFDAVAAVYVYVDDLRDVENVGRALEDAGYSTSFTLRAFDDLAGTLDGGIGTGFVLIVAMLVLSLVLTFTNLQSYLTLAHRDIGILKHIGYTDSRIVRFYRRRLAVLVGKACVAAVTLILAVGAVRLADRPWFIAIDVGLVLGLGGLLLFTMAVVHVPHHVRRPVLELLKMDRQFD
jgi:hypothetical protein